MSTTPEQPDNGHLEDVPITEIYQDPDFNCRGRISPHECIELATNMVRLGQLHPIIVRSYSNPEKPQYKYQVVEGSRRLVAAKINRWTTIKATVRDEMSDEEAEEVNFVENLQRQELTFMQEVRGLKKFKLGIVGDDIIARRLNVGSNWVRVRREAAALPQDVQSEIEVGFITQKQIGELYKMKEKPDQLYEAVREIKSAKLRGKTAKVASLETKRKNISKAKHRLPNEIFEMQDHIREAFRGQCEMEGEDIPDEVQAYIRALGWAGGAINDMSIYYDLEAIANKLGLSYSKPAEVEAILS